MGIIDFGDICPGEQAYSAICQLFDSSDVNELIKDCTGRHVAAEMVLPTR